MSIEYLTLGNYTLGIDLTSGKLVTLKRGGSPSAIDGSGLPSVSVDIGWRPVDTELEHRSNLLQDNTITLLLSLGPLSIYDQYTYNDEVIERTITVENDSDDDVQLTGVRLTLSGVYIIDLDNCLFEAPANVIRPRLPLRRAALQQVRKSASPKEHWRPIIEPDEYFAPGRNYVFGKAFGDAPDVGPGLMVIHNPNVEWSLLTWYVSKDEAAAPWIGGEDGVVSLGHDLSLAGWLAPGQQITGGTQYIRLHRGDYESALVMYRSYYQHTGITPTIYRDVDRMADLTAIYEVHPGMFGGFDGLQQALPSLAEMGIDLLYLLPVMSYRNKKEQPWDENWESSGSPYAMHDFEVLDPTLGTEEDFIALVNAAHDLRMRVVMDFVAQGSSLESPYVEEHPEWYARDEYGNMVHSHGWNDTWSLDWANPEYQAFMRNWAIRFVEEYGIDGYRVDAPHGKEPNWDKKLPYHASKTNLGAAKLLEDLRRELLEARPDALLYCELFGPLWVHSHDISNDYHPHAMIYQLYERRLTPYELNEYLHDYWAILPHSANMTPSPRVCFTETHDTRSFPCYALRGSDIAKALLGVIVMNGFIPMIWSGQEQNQHEFLKNLLHARRGSYALRRGAYIYNEVLIDDRNHYRHQDEPAEWLYTVIRYDRDDILLGVASFFPEQVTFQLTLPLYAVDIHPNKTYRLKDLISGKYWYEDGISTFSGTDFARLMITPRMYTPYIFLIEPVEEN